MSILLIGSLATISRVMPPHPAA